MKKFSITELETARRLPVDFGKALKDGATSASNFGGYPKSMRWLNAICKYHEEQDISKAILSLEKGFSSRKDTAKNRQELEAFIDALSNYESEIKKRKLSLIKSREPVSLTLTRLVKITGQIPVIFMKPAAGFSAYFITKENILWETELKYPVIQNYIAADIFSCNVDEVEVGYIDYYSGEFHEISFSPSEIKSADKELKEIGESISLNLK
jgi:hypothetical protein